MFVFPAVLGASPPGPQASLAVWIGYLEHPEKGWPKTLPQAERARIDEIPRAYAPRIWFHKDERILPTDPATFLAQSSLWYEPPGKNARIVAKRGEFSARDLTNIPKAFALSWLFKEIAAGPKFDPSRLFLKHESPPALNRAPGAATPAPTAHKAPIFWKLSDHPLVARLQPPGEGGTVARILIEYWYHLPFSDANLGGVGNHQGDWEGIAVLVELEREKNGKLRHQPLAAYYAAHDDGSWHCRAGMDWTTATDANANARHPEAYSSLGSHATYATAGSFPRFGGVIGTDKTERGIAWDTWTDVRPLAREPYYGYQGAWGQTALFGFMSGPRAPAALSKRFPKGDTDEEMRTLLALCNL